MSEQPLPLWVQALVEHRLAMLQGREKERGNYTPPGWEYAQKRILQGLARDILAGPPEVAQRAAAQETKERQMRGQYQDDDIVGYRIRSAYFDPKKQDLMGEDETACSECWGHIISHGSFIVKRPITFVETGEQEYVCRTCHLQLPTRGEP